MSTRAPVTADVYLLVLGLGLGMVMQVLVLAVQNAVDYSVLGAATSGVTLARGIGGSIGAAVFGTIFTSRLRSELHGAISGPLGAQVAGGARLTGRTGGDAAGGGEDAHTRTPTCMRCSRCSSSPRGSARSASC